MIGRILVIGTIIFIAGWVTWRQIIRDKKLKNQTPKN